MTTNAKVAANSESTSIDIGLRNYMIAVYNKMFLGIVLSGVAAFLTASISTGEDGALNEIGQALFQGPLALLFIACPLVIVFMMSFGVQKRSPATLSLMFYAFATLLGVSLSSVVLSYSTASIAKVFFITASMFGALSLYGYTTRRSLSGMGSFMVMGLFGLVIAMIVNLFMQSPALDFALCIVGVLVFSGLTAYDTQKIKEMYDYADSGAARSKLVTMGALELYLDFVNLFLFFLRFFGGSSKD